MIAIGDTWVCLPLPAHQQGFTVGWWLSNKWRFVFIGSVYVWYFSSNDSVFVVSPPSCYPHITLSYPLSVYMSRKTSSLKSPKLFRHILVQT